GLFAQVPSLGSLRVLMAQMKPSIPVFRTIFAGQLRLGASGIWFAVLFAAVKGYAFSALYVYGDSLSDTGRVPAPAPEYYNGRWSNGSNCIEYLSTKLGFAYDSLNNFAYAGTTTSDLAAEVNST